MKFYIALSLCMVIACSGDCSPNTGSDGSKACTCLSKDDIKADSSLICLQIGELKMLGEESGNDCGDPESETDPLSEPCSWRTAGDTIANYCFAGMKLEGDDADNFKCILKTCAAGDTQLNMACTYGDNKQCQLLNYYWKNGQKDMCTQFKQCGDAKSDTVPLAETCSCAAKDSQIFTICPKEAYCWKTGDTCNSAVYAAPTSKSEATSSSATIGTATGLIVAAMMNL